MLKDGCPHVTARGRAIKTDKGEGNQANGTARKQDERY